MTASISASTVIFFYLELQGNKKVVGLRKKTTTESVHMHKTNLNKTLMEQFTPQG